MITPKEAREAVGYNKLATDFKGFLQKTDKNSPSFTDSYFLNLKRLKELSSDLIPYLLTKIGSDQSLLRQLIAPLVSKNYEEQVIEFIETRKKK